jgi:hypothetical protein
MLGAMTPGALVAFAMLMTVAFVMHTVSFCVSSTGQDTTAPSVVGAVVTIAAAIVVFSCAFSV